MTKDSGKQPLKESPQKKEAEKSPLEKFKEKVSLIENLGDLTSTISSQIYDRNLDYDKIIVPSLKTGLKKYYDIAFSELLKKYFIVFLWSDQSISDYHLDSIYRATHKKNLDKESKPQKKILLVIKSGGGSIEPAYKISKLCKELGKDGFEIVVPRYAKSAATLIALGANKLHMGYLSELGPIDTQIRGFPALGVQDAFRKIAELVKEVPEAKDLLDSYLKSVPLYIFGWLTRVPESAVQYGQKLLTMSNLKNSQDKAKTIAKKLVHEYKDHRFVIDRNEAKIIFDYDYIVEHTEEINISEDFYQKITYFETMLNFLWKPEDSELRANIEIVGAVDENGISIVDSLN